MENSPLLRLDISAEERKKLLSFCRLKPGEIWRDRVFGHSVGCLDAACDNDILRLVTADRAALAIHDPPYNLAAFEERNIEEYTNWCRKWIKNTDRVLQQNSSLYVWLGADQNNGFQPLPDFIIMMRSCPSFSSRSFITMRNQRGYGTQKNWMAVRQELLYYVKGKPVFNIGAEYTNIPKILKGYYKKVGDRITENLERGNSPCIRAGNVWVDIQQVFYRMQENASGCFAQKPLKAIKRIIEASSSAGELVADFFAHSGTTLLACEQTGRRCATIDTDPVFCEITIRRLEHFRQTGKSGWQNSNPFAPTKTLLSE